MDQQYDIPALMRALIEGPSGDAKKDARTQALMQAGFTMLGSKGSFGDALGAGGIAGLGAYQGALDQRRQQDAQRLSLGMQFEDYGRKKQIRDLAPKFARSPLETALEQGEKAGSVGPTVGNAKRAETAPSSFDYAGYINALAQYDPAQAMQLSASMAKDTPFNKVDPKDYTPESVQKFARTRNHADLQPVRKMEVVQGQVFDPYSAKPGTVIDDLDPNKPFRMVGGQVVPNQAYQDYSIKKSRAGATNLSVGITQEKEENKAVGKYFGEQFADLQKAGFNAQGKINRANRMEQLLDRGVTTGKLAGAAKEVAALAQSFGVTVDPNLPAVQAFEALSNEMALEARNPSGGAGMPGAMSDKDREFLQNITPSLSKTPEGNRLIIETQRRLAKRDQEVARQAREYRKKHGTVDEGFLDELATWSESNPMFSDLQPSQQGASGGGTGAGGAPKVLRFDAQGNLIQ